jgi:hypothetical protein
MFPGEVSGDSDESDYGGPTTYKKRIGRTVLHTRSGEPALSRYRTKAPLVLDTAWLVGNRDSPMRWPIPGVRQGWDR